MNWTAIEAIGSILAAFATTVAVMVALYESGVIFKERIRIYFGLNYVMLDPLTNSKHECFEIKATNGGVRPVYIQAVGFNFGKKYQGSFTIPRLEYGKYGEPVNPGTSSVFINNRATFIDAVSEAYQKNKTIGEEKIRILVSTDLKTYVLKTKYRVKDIANQGISTQPSFK